MHWIFIHMKHVQSYFVFTLTYECITELFVGLFTHFLPLNIFQFAQVQCRLQCFRGPVQLERQDRRFDSNHRR